MPTHDTYCVTFLQWALPQLRMRWRGFRRVRRQVCRRLAKRHAHLRLPDLAAYRAFLLIHPEEWECVDAACRITISRFYRDRSVFDALGAEVLPELAAAASEEGRSELRCWSAGCASGEEPHTVKLVWELAVAASVPEVGLSIVGTDVDEHLLARAERARYPASSLRDLPEGWRARAFVREGEEYELRREFREGVHFAVGDLRREVPEGRFDLVLCRSLAFTYYDEGLQREVLARLVGARRPGGALVIGRRERLPEGDFGVAPWDARNGVYRAG